MIVIPDIGMDVSTFSTGDLHRLPADLEKILRLVHAIIANLRQHVSPTARRIHISKPEEKLATSAYRIAKEESTGVVNVPKMSDAGRSLLTEVGKTQLRDAATTNTSVPNALICI